MILDVKQRAIFILHVFDVTIPFSLYVIRYDCTIKDLFVVSGYAAIFNECFLETTRKSYFGH